MPIHKLARYRVKKEHLPAAAAATADFVQMVGKREGGTALYRALQDADDPTRFTHYMVFNTKAAEENHLKTAWRKAFEAAMQPLLAEPPAATEVHLVGEKR